MMPTNVLGSHILVLTAERQTQRQVARSLRASGTDCRSVRDGEGLQAALADRWPDLVILDVDGADLSIPETAIERIANAPRPPPVILLSTGPDKAALVELLQRWDIGNLVAKHGAIRAAHPMLDERELLVTCEKVLCRDIFGIDKYIGKWGILLHREVLHAMADKAAILERFEQFVTDLDCPPSVVPEIVTVADEFIINAAVHAPRAADGSARYESQGARADLVLEEHEQVEIQYGCDGQILMVSVSDRFGRLSKETLYRYLGRGLGTAPIQVEDKAGGAGLGLSFAARNIHQLVFNIQDCVRTEAIAGWYLRVPNAREFGQVAKSLNVFWLPSSG